ncbi:MAG: glutamate racemase [Prevotellaceae bacterium]|jgi:glutamate racemase|nr:glutamate racemase [Prevotellaceae bacterium]
MAQNIIPIGIFDSGYGGLTILETIRARLPQYDYVYLGDNARTPYGSRSFEIVYQYTLQCVEALFAMGCRLVILACNTASAKALRTIQQHDLPRIDPARRVLGVIRPTVEQVGKLTQSQHVGLLATSGTVQSESYPAEIHKLFPEVKIAAEACPMWVPLIENNEFDNAGADFFIQKNVENLLRKDREIDTVILGCTHYPLISNKIKKYASANVKVFSQSEVVAESLADYLKRHHEIEEKCSKGGSCRYFTTEASEKFRSSASIFLNKDIDAEHLELK